MIDKETTILELSTFEHQGYGYTVSAFLSDRNIMRYYGDAMRELVLTKIADRLAAEFVERHGAAVLAKMSPEAVGGSLSLAATEKVAASVDGVRQAIKDRPDPVTYVTNRNYNSIF